MNIHSAHAATVEPEARCYGTLPENRTLILRSPDQQFIELSAWSYPTQGIAYLSAEAPVLPSRVNSDAGDWLETGKSGFQAHLVEEIQAGRCEAVAAGLFSGKAGSVEEKDSMTGAGEEERGGTARWSCSDDDNIKNR